MQEAAAVSRAGGGPVNYFRIRSHEDIFAFICL